MYWLEEQQWKYIFEKGAGGGERLPEVQFRLYMMVGGGGGGGRVERKRRGVNEAGQSISGPGAGLHKGGGGGGLCTVSALVQSG